MFLTGCEIPNMADFMTELKTAYPDFSPETLNFAGANYGTEAPKLLDLSRQQPEYEEIICEDGQILASVIYAVRNESAQTLEDIVMRRTGVGNIGHPGKERLEKIGAVAAKELGWDSNRLAEEVAGVEKILRLPE
jgi:glycerol-3-phosphate dehydrogenase